MNAYVLRTTMISVAVVAALVAAGCGNSERPGQQQGTVINSPKIASPTSESGDAKRNRPMTREQLKQQADRTKREAADSYREKLTPPGVRRCPDVGDVNRVIVSKTTCTDATRLIAANVTSLQRLTPRPTNISGYKCMRAGQAQETELFICRRGKASIRFTR